MCLVIDTHPNIAMKYLTLDNGGRPFMVSVQNSKVEVFTREKNNKCPSEEEEENNTGWVIPVLTVETCLKIFIGDDLAYGNTGNSILLQKSNTEYIYISGSIKEFKCPEQIVEFHAPVGNSDVPYPFAVTESGRVILFEDFRDDTMTITNKIEDLHERLEQDKMYPYTYEWQAPRDGSRCSERISFITLHGREILL